MLSQQIRTLFLQFFQARGHLLVPSASLVPHDDPSLLLVGAGMVPFKPYFLGRQEPPAPRLTSCQRAFRTVDIDEVGSSPRHDTFFEMLGNFSFGSYFKEEAIAFAFEFLVDDLGLDAGRLHYSVHPDDLESERLWRKVAGVGPDRIVALEDNFWQAGPTGPCGVDSEIYYDLGPEHQRSPGEVPGTGDRFLEVWNLVFMDSERLDDSTIRPLARKGVDTGMGMERISMVVQGKPSIFDTDLFAPIVADFQRRARADLPPEAALRHLRILADHTRGACALLADGVVPLNEGRGYVLRRILRRALVSSMSLQVEGGLAPAARVVAEGLGESFPELRSSLAGIEGALVQEEERFRETLDRGMGQFEQMAAPGQAISADQAFRLHDTFGFPIELTHDLASARGLQVDSAGFQLLLDEQRQKGRAHRGAAGPQLPGRGLPSSAFVGYDQLEAEVRVLALLEAGEPAGALGPGVEGQVVLDRSPFYPEGGGQVGDRGRLTWEGGSALVLDSQPVAPDSIVLTCAVEGGRLEVGGTARAVVDAERRRGCAAHHSATHLLNATLRRVLGPEVVQRGSLVDPEHATFDFSWPRALTPDEQLELERGVNAAVRANLDRRIEELTLVEARDSGAISLPDETYREPVRVVGFGDFSRELCGGTHVAATGEVGAVVLTGSRSVGQGLRRLELRAGAAAESWWEQQRSQLDEVAAGLRTPAAEAGARVAALQERLRELERSLREVAQGAQSGGESALLVGTAEILIHDVPFPMERGEMRRVGEGLLTRAPLGGTLVLAAGGLLLLLSEAMTRRGLEAGRIAKEVCEALGGAGGGRPDLGQGTLPESAHRSAVQRLRTILETALEES